MPPRIAIPVPHSGDADYAHRALPQYERAVMMAGGEPIRIPLDLTPAEVMKIIEQCDGVLLPGSKADVDPAKFNAARSSQTAAPDPRRDTVDELLLQDAYNMRKPVLGICYGLQSLNVYRSGSLIQHIPDFLPPGLGTTVNHEAGRTVEVAHKVAIEPQSVLAEIVRGSLPAQVQFPGGEDSAQPKPAASPGASATVVIPVNSSHHQSADGIGDGLTVVARCVEDGMVEALEGTSRDHFVMAVQWHPERSVDDDQPSRAIFRALVEAARARHEQLTGEFENVQC
jgi:putative glutamine amidotransferase